MRSPRPQFQVSPGVVGAIGLPVKRELGLHSYPSLLLLAGERKRHLVARQRQRIDFRTTLPSPACGRGREGKPVGERPAGGAGGATRRARGFTLIELLVVMAVAALMMAAVPTLYSAAFPGLELKSTARRTAAVLRTARETAIRRGEDYAVTVDLAARRLSAPGLSDLGIPKRLTIQLDGAAVEARGEQRGAIRFFPDGSSSGGRIVLALGDHGYQVGVTWLTGQIELASWSAP